MTPTRAAAANVRPRVFTRDGSAFGREGSAFTLVELMISIALVLILVLGINQVFKLTSETVGMGQVTSTAMRDQRAATVTMEQDLTNALTSQAPFFIIHSEAVPAFRNRADELTNAGLANKYTTSPENLYGASEAPPTNPLFRDLNGDGNAGPDSNGNIVAGEFTAPLDYNVRNHRLDMIAFFARGQFQRQTGNPGSLTSTTTSNEAFITYGHARIPNNLTNPSFYNPGQADNVAGSDKNDNNKYATQFVLARTATLLQPTVNAAVTAYRRQAAPPFTDLQPLSMNSFTDSLGSPAANWYRPYGSTSADHVRSDMFDLAETSINDFSERFAVLLRQFPAPVAAYPYLEQWYRMPIQAPPYNTKLNDYANIPATAFTGSNSCGSGVVGGAIPAKLIYRRVCDVRANKPINSLGSSLATPYLLGGCTQFIVEFAGDFLTQQNDPAAPATYGLVLDDQPDGEVDYVVNAAGQKQIRWYGMPRDTTGDGSIPAPYGAKATLTSNQILDVVPIRDVVRAGANTATVAPTLMSAATQARLANGAAPDQDDPNVPCERNYDTTSTAFSSFKSAPLSHVPPPATTGDYLTDQNTVNAAKAGALDYTAAWAFGGPKFVRLTITLEDPAGRLPNGQTFELIYALKP